MARGLDELEGEAVEAVLFVLLVLIAIVVFTSWRGLAGLDPKAALAMIVKKLWNGIDSLFSKAVEGLSTPIGDFTGGAGVAEVHTGTSTMSDAPVDYNSPNSSGGELSMYDQQESE